MTDEAKPLVSVKILTFNHESVISRCIEGALMQRTTFPFEIIIGEDCSTDGTLHIIKDYQHKYPDKIRVITSEKNVGMMANAKRTNLACRGEYIALCDGDDYWIDPLKLQKQWEMIERNGAVMATHSSIALYYEDEKLLRATIDQPIQESGILRVEDMILKNSEFHTSSLFIQTKIILNKPDWYYRSLTSGDIPIKLFAVSIGKVYYINQIMSVYQSGTTGSWVKENSKKILNDKHWRNDYEKAFLELYKNFDAHTGRKYTQAIDTVIQKRLSDYYINYGNLDFIKFNKKTNPRLQLIYNLSRLAPSSIRKLCSRKVVETVLPFL
jgi:glycosyltransferase involved in cell wall biosynthesis